MEYWDFASGKVVFITHKSVPAMKILPEAGKVVVKDFNFTTGTIEFDLEVIVAPSSTRVWVSPPTAEFSSPVNSESSARVLL